MRRIIDSFDWMHYVLILCALLLIVLLRPYGVLLACITGVVIFYFLRVRGDSKETKTVIASIHYSAADIQDVIDAFDAFLTDTSTDALADRTLQRPGLADADCTDPDIEAFHYGYASAKRFIHRLPARINASDCLGALESLLSVTDRRAAELQEQWIAARRTALRLGQHYPTM